MLNSKKTTEHSHFDWENHGKGLRGQALVKTKDEKGTWQGWNTHNVDRIWKAIEDHDPLDGPRIFFIDSPLVQIHRCENEDTERKAVDSYDAFALDRECGRYLRETCGFPHYLTNTSWCKSSGFAGSKRTADADLSWFRILIKIVPVVTDHYWHEMTFLIHQPHDGFVTVFCFDVPDKCVPVPYAEVPQSSVKEGRVFHAEERAFDFMEELRCDLTVRGKDFIPDWRYMQSILLQQAVVVVDAGIWACARAVREVEQILRGQSEGPRFAAFEFGLAHDVLRHVLHNHEVLQVSTEVLQTWLERYHEQQKQRARFERKRSRNHQHTSQSPHSQISRSSTLAQVGTGDDNEEEEVTLPEESQYDSLVATLQILMNNFHRNASMESRLRNEISLGFNRAAQQESHTMRTISVVTAMFLPATFISTLFSMSFFNFFTPGQPTPVWGVTEEIWTYFAVAGPLTACALIFAYWTAILQLPGIAMKAVKERLARRREKKELRELKDRNAA